MRRPFCLVSVLALVAVVSACAGGSGTQDDQGMEVDSEIGVEFDPGDAVVEIGRLFELPPDSDSDGAVIGEDELALDTADGDWDIDSMWTTNLDANDDGTSEDVQLVWDDEDNVLYAYAVETFDCIVGDGTADGGVLMAVYGDGNAAGMPEGAGWYVVGLDAGECGAQAKALWGCRFDEDGQETSCGMAALDEATGEITITDESG